MAYNGYIPLLEVYMLILNSLVKPSTPGLLIILHLPAPTFATQKATLQVFFLKTLTED